MLPDTNTTWSILASLLLAGMLGAAAWARRAYVRREARRVEERAANKAMHDAILGEPPVLDRAGKEMEPARPGLVHLQREQSDRVGKVEDAIVEFRHAIGIYTEVLKRMDVVERDVNDLKKARVEKVMQSVERAATAQSATEALKLIGNQDVVDGEVQE